MFGEFESINKSKKSYLPNKNTDSLYEDYDVPLKKRIIDFIAQKSEVILKSQQRNEPDFTTEERRNIASELLEKNPCQFLYRFGKHLRIEHLHYFTNFSDNEDMEIYIQETQKLLNDSTKKLRIRNRRFGAMQKMKSSGSTYFSEDEMRKRDPLLYEQLIDKNLTDEERSQIARATSGPPIETFSELLFEQIERNKIRDKQKVQEKLEDDCFEEDDDDEEEEEYVDPTPINDTEKKLLRMEFVSSICSQFVSGKDEDFDYSKVDESEENDLLEWETIDQQERYFDEEEPEIVPVEEKRDDTMEVQEL